MPKELRAASPKNHRQAQTGHPHLRECVTDETLYYLTLRWFTVLLGPDTRIRSKDWLHSRPFTKPEERRPLTKSRALPCTVGAHLGLVSLLPSPRNEPQGSLCDTTLAACADESVVPTLQVSQLPTTKELPGSEAFCHHPLLPHA